MPMGGVPDVGMFRGESTMVIDRIADCLHECRACADACHHCAVSCLKEDDVQAMVECIALDMDCAATCDWAAGAMARDSRLVSAISAVCAQVCEACGDECSRHDAAHCQDCAAACRRCAEACRAVAGP